MEPTMGIIYTGERNVNLQDLTRVRPVATLPFGGRYRIIDFILSNMVRSRITNIGVITQSNYSSVIDHLGSGVDWDLDRKRDGLFIFPPCAVQETGGWFKGSAEALGSVAHYIQHSRQKYCVVSGSHMVYNLDLEQIMEFHQEHGADITMAYYEDQQLTPAEAVNCTLLQTAPDERIYDIAVAPRIPSGRKVYMDLCILEKELLLQLVDQCVVRGHYNLVRDGIQSNLQALKVYGYQYKGYVARIDSVQSYYQHNMALLEQDVRNQLISSVGKVLTKVKNEPPARHANGARVRNCLVANGCEIYGEVENSVLFRGVRIDRGARVCNSIIMQGSHVGEDTLLEQVVLDKSVVISPGKSLIGQANYPLVISKGVTV
jgi:glucose-1-phosphate adenylyltransferase